VGGTSEIEGSGTRTIRPLNHGPLCGRGSGHRACHRGRRHGRRHRMRQGHPGGTAKMRKAPPCPLPEETGTVTPCPPFDAESAKAEANRCLSTRVCQGCEICQLMCPDQAITKDEATHQPVIDLTYCKGCGPFLPEKGHHHGTRTVNASRRSPIIACFSRGPTLGAMVKKFQHNFPGLLPRHYVMAIFIG
jgi:ferredoxin